MLNVTKNIQLTPSKTGNKPINNEWLSPYVNCIGNIKASSRWSSRSQKTVLRLEQTEPGVNQDAVGIELTELTNGKPMTDRLRLKLRRKLI